MQMLYGYDVAADLAPAHGRTTRSCTRSAAPARCVTDPRQIGPALDRAFAADVPTSSTSSPTSTRSTRARPSGSDGGVGSRPSTALRRGDPARGARRGRRDHRRRLRAVHPGPRRPVRRPAADTAARDRDAELWVAVDEQGDLLGSVTRLPAGLPVARGGRPRTRASSGCCPWPRTPSGLGRRRGAGAPLPRPLRGPRGSGRSCSRACPRWPRRTGSTTGWASSAPPERDWEPVPGVRLIGFRRDLEDGT